MKRFYWFLVILWLFPFGIYMGEQSLFAQSTSKPAYSSSKDYQIFVPGEIVVKARPNMTPDEINSLNKAHGAEILERSSTLGFYRLKVSEPVEKASISYQSHPAVEYAQPNYIFAEVGEGFITLFDLELAIHRMIPLLRQRFQQLQAKEDLLRSLLNDKLFSQAAKDEDLQSIRDNQEKSIKASFKRRDKNNDGLITKDEFISKKKGFGMKKGVQSFSKYATKRERYRKTEMRGLEVKGGV